VKAFRFHAEPIETDARTPDLWALGCLGIVEEGDELVAYFDGAVDLPIAGVWEEVDDTDYVAAYHASLQPLDLGALVIAPSHTSVKLSVPQRPLWLDPGMAFGSGHHETTAMALEALIALTLFDRDVLDVGAGSGILAIGADLLGARSSVGLDNDPLTLPVAEENRRRNGSRARFSLAHLDDAWPAASADLIVANLYAELHVALMDRYLRVLRPGGDLLMTGILNERCSAVTAAYPLQLATVGERRRGAWTLLHARRATAP
jgi:ribosomal protein L11 methyltransferase